LEKKNGEALPAPLERPKTGSVFEWETFYRETFSGEAPEVLPLPDGRVFLPPEVLPQSMRGMRILRAGVPAGEVRSGRFVPGHALALAFPAAVFQRSVALAGDSLERFLAGETVACGPALSGWCAVTALGHPIGWGKAVNGVRKTTFRRVCGFCGERGSLFFSLKSKEAKETHIVYCCQGKRKKKFFLFLFLSRKRKEERCYAFREKSGENLSRGVF